jgi:hypothetical protein
MTARQQKQQHKLSNISFSRRRTMLDIYPEPPSATSSAEVRKQQQQQRSRLPTPSMPSRRQSLVVGLNVSVPRYGSSTSSNTTESQIPHPNPPRRSHGSFIDGVGQNACLNQDGRYPLVPRPRKRTSGVNPHTVWGLVNAGPLPRSHTMGNMVPGNSSNTRRFMGSTSSSAARVSHREVSRGNLDTTTKMTMPADRRRGW